MIESSYEAQEQTTASNEFIVGRWHPLHHEGKLALSTKAKNWNRLGFRFHDCLQSTHWPLWVAVVNETCTVIRATLAGLWPNEIESVCKHSIAKFGVKFLQFNSDDKRANASIAAVHWWRRYDGIVNMYNPIYAPRFKDDNSHPVPSLWSFSDVLAFCYVIFLLKRLLIV